MSTTNSTPNYGLPQYVGGDKPTWLGDVNNTNLLIDVALKSIQDVIDAQEVLLDGLQDVDGSYQAAIETLQTQSLANTTSVTNMLALVGGHTSSITSLQNDVGSVALNTTAQNVKSAVNEVFGVANSVDSAVDAINNNLANKGTVIELTQATAVATWQSKTVASLSQYRYILITLNDVSGTCVSSNTVPLALFLALNTSSKVLNTGGVSGSACAYYGSDTTVGIIVSSSSFSAKLYGIK